MSTTNDQDENEPPEVLNWCRTLVAAIRHGGLWGIPRSGIVFKIDKENQRLVLTKGHESNSDFIATRRVFAQIGWDVTAKD
jgi:hypothetical protein